jgi:hypothetical protein
LKRVFWRNPRFVLKIGAIKNQTRLNISSDKLGIIGLELGADIFEVSLDKIYARDEKQNIQFYEDLIYRHLLFCNRDLEIFQAKGEYNFYGTTYTKPVDTFINYIFKERSGIAKLIKGAGALPRDFIEMFDYIARSKDYSINQPWSMPDINRAIRAHFINNKQIDIDIDSDAADVCGKIMDIVKNNNHRLIIVPRKINRVLAYSIAELYHRRLLHDVDQSDIPATLRLKYSFYYADLGLQLDVSREKLDELDHDEFFPLTGSETKGEIERYSLK